MRVVVTGSSGFIGDHLVRALVDRGDTVLGIDKRDSPALSPGAEFARCDLLNAEHLSATIGNFNPDAIAHLAARTDIDEKHDIRGYDANITGVANLVEAVRVAPRIQRVLFTSTQLVCRVGYQPRADDDYMPSTLYGESKVMGEKIVRSANGGGVTWCIIRPTTVWGPGMSAHYQRFFGMIQKGSYFHVGHKPRLKSFGYVGNVVHQYMAFLDAPTSTIHGQTFYVGDFEPISLQAWADELALAMRSRRIRTLPESMARIAARIGDVVNAAGFHRFPFNTFRLNNVLTEYTFDMSSTRSVCGENPYSLRQGAEATARWFLNQR